MSLAWPSWVNPKTCFPRVSGDEPVDDLVSCLFEAVFPA